MTATVEARTETRVLTEWVALIEEVAATLTALPGANDLMKDGAANLVHAATEYQRRGFDGDAHRVWVTVDARQSIYWCLSSAVTQLRTSWSRCSSSLFRTFFSTRVASAASVRSTLRSVTKLDAVTRVSGGSNAGWPGRPPGRCGNPPGVLRTHEA
jgi:hypothetical protein